MCTAGAAGSVDLDRYTARRGPRFDQFERGSPCSILRRPNRPGGHLAAAQSRKERSDDGFPKLFRVTLEVADLEQASALYAELFGQEGRRLPGRGTTSITVA